MHVHGANFRARRRPQCALPSPPRCRGVRTCARVSLPVSRIFSAHTGDLVVCVAAPFDIDSGYALRCSCAPPVCALPSIHGPSNTDKIEIAKDLRSGHAAAHGTSACSLPCQHPPSDLSNGICSDVDDTQAPYYERLGMICGVRSLSFVSVSAAGQSRVAR